ncbi:MAG: nitrile hydratase subunit beta [Haloferacaceae archaeon]
MNGIHDMGGMHGFGDVPRDPAAFHADWERTILAIDRALKAQGVYNGDQKRHAIERMDPQRYLDGYFERWVAAVETLLAETGTLDPDRIDARAAALADAAAAGGADRTALDALPAADADADAAAVADRALAEFRAPAAHDRAPQEPRFEPGDRVIVRRRHPAGHTRCPRYVRGCPGTVRAHHGTHAYPDARARGEAAAHPLYGVRFEAADVWGPDGDGRAVNVDLWEPYLRAAGGGNGDGEND